MNSFSHKRVILNLVSFGLLATLYLFSISACSNQKSELIQKKLSNYSSSIASKENTVAESTSNNSTEAIPSHYSKVTIPDFNYTPPLASDYRVVINEYTIAYLYPTPQLPIINMSTIIPKNNFAQSPNQVAKLNLLSTMYRRGGTESLSPSAIDDSLEFLSASISASFSDYYSSFAVNTLKKDFDQILNLGKDMITKPRFDQEILKLQKDNYIQGIKHRFDRTPAISEDLYTYAMYKSHPLYWMAESNDIDSISRDDLISLNSNRFTPDKYKKIIVGVSGDFDKDQMIAKLKSFFKDWPGLDSASTPKVLEPTHKQSMQKIYVVDKNAQQAIIKLGQPFIKRPHPDYYKATLASYILGSGGFTSRLTEKIRTKEGLAYSVRSFTGSNYNHAVSSGVYLQTKMESSNYAIKLVFEEINRLIKDGVSDDELDRAKEGIIQSIPGMFDTPSNTINAFVMSEYWGRQDDHFKMFPDKINAITKDDIVAMVKKYFSPENMTITVVGKLDQLKQKDPKAGISIDDLGEVIVVPMDSLVIR